MKNIILSRANNRWFYFFVVAITFTSIILISGCFDDLSRSKAREIIIKHFDYPISETQELDIGSKIMSTSIKWLKSLKNEGLINYTYHRRFGANNVVSVFLTNKGKKYVIGDIKTRSWPYGGQKYVKVKVAEKEFGEITGIKISGDKKEAIVQYTWKFANLTPFSKDCKYNLQFGAFIKGKFYDEDKIHKDKVYMTLYDDGWRIDN